MMRTASIRLETGAEQAKALAALQAAYVDACNRLVPLVREHRVWNRVALHQRAYTMLREATPLGSQMCCKAIFSVRTRRKRGSGASGRTRRSRKSVSTAPACTSTSAPIPLRARRSPLHTLDGRITVPMRLGEHQRRILDSGQPKEAELVLRNGKWFFNLVVESGAVQPVASGHLMGVDIGEHNHGQGLARPLPCPALSY